MSSPGVATFVSLTRRELLRFRRQPSRIAASIGAPAIMGVFFAGGFAQSFAPPAKDGIPTDYGAFVLPGIVTLVAVFSSIFAAISLIEDRREGFLQAALVSPAPRVSIVAAKAVGGSLIAALQCAIVLIAAPFVAGWPGVVPLLLALLAATLAAIAITSMGLALAWWVNSSEGFHGVMNVILMPMWLLSGAFFPAHGASTWMNALMAINPLRWTTDAIRAGITPNAPTPLLAWVIAVAFALLMLAFAGGIVGRATLTAKPKSRRGGKKKNHD
ncbi:MAG: ABC transporter permease [Phycisphaeraceae bacterium]|nr:ABC transporter permease [Phycisphaeraceae bacterium]